MTDKQQVGNLASTSVGATTENAAVKFSIHQPMVSGAAEAAKRRYHMVPNLNPNGRRWLYADDDSPGDHVYCDGGKGSQGFGGATLRFELVGGSTVEFIGPWHGNPNSMFRETGVDIRNTHRTQGIAAFTREYGGWPKPDTYREIIHYDERSVVGAFERVKHIAQNAANATGRCVYYAFISSGGGGGQSGSCQPESVCAQDNAPTK